MSNVDETSDRDGTTRGRATTCLLVGLLIAFALPELDLAGWLARSGAAGAAGGPAAAFGPLREAIWWSIALLLLLHVRFVEQRPLASIGLRAPTARSLLIGVLTAVLLIVIVFATYALVFPWLGLSMNRAATAGITRHTIGFQVYLALRAGVVEEILYRGYPIARIAEASGSRTLAVMVSVVVFTAVHLGYWGAAQLLIVAPAAVVLALLFVWRRDLSCNMLAHFLVDLAGFLAASAQT